ncbi:hypothetical protein SP15_154 [Bacillus phage SP-15]|uniref:Uncharacterized protein n=1 Tax=Bacillus phage SP-15 TaxID=1792032 RepID=A0A127AWJ0_9CAUD|nr:hypothetical protein SP15_154 [Bacillus phage SP-15]AMM44952.1 hypothetical protein SP15_154 [Bacillus phage SP-15]
MTRLSRNNSETREMIKSLSTLTGLDPKAIETVLVAQELYIQHQVYLKYKANPEEPPEIELPYLGSLKMFPINYKNRSDVTDNAAARVKFYPENQFKRRLRKSMYQEKNFLIEHSLESFKDHFVQKFKSLI